MQAILSDDFLQKISLPFTYSFYDVLPTTISSKMDIKTCQAIESDKRQTTGWDLMCVGYISGHMLHSKTIANSKLWLLDGTPSLPNRIGIITGVERIPSNLFNLYPLFNYKDDIGLKIVCSDETPILGSYTREALSLQELSGGKLHYILALLQLLLRKEWEFILSQLGCPVVSYGPGFYIVESVSPPNIDGFEVKEVGTDDCVNWFIETFWSRLQA